MQTILIAKTNSRSVLGLLNEYDWLLQAMHYVDSEIQTLDPAVLSNRMCNAVTAIPPEESPRSAAIRLLSAQNE